MKYKIVGCVVGGVAGAFFGSSFGIVGFGDGMAGTIPLALICGVLGAGVGSWIARRKGGQR